MNEFNTASDYINSLKKRTSSLINSMELYADDKGIPILGKDASSFLKQIIRINKPENVLEIGTAIGYTAINIAECLPDNAIVDTIEKDEKMYSQACININDSGLKSKINIILGDGLNFNSLTQRKKYDLIFLDCDKEFYPVLFEKIVNSLKPGGLFLADNLLWHGNVLKEEVPENYKESTIAIKEFNKMFMSSKKLISEIIPVGDGIGLAIKLA